MREGGASAAGSVLVIGAGWSGLAAALELADAGLAVTLIDAAPQAGGRARRLDVALGDRRYALDNGQHLLIGAYRETLSLMRRVGVAPEHAFARCPFLITYPDGFCLQAARLPAPLHLGAALLTARGLPWSARLAMARAVGRFRRQRWRAPAEDSSAASLLTDQPPLLLERLWEPLCVAALNARLAQSSAQVFLAVLRDSLGAQREASDLLLPRGDLSALLPDAAVAVLERTGVRIELRCAADALRPADGAWRLQTRAGERSADAIVLALPPKRAAALLATVGDPALDGAVALLDAIDMAPIATVYLRYAPGTRLPQPMLALAEAPTRGRFGQWAFDRGALAPDCDAVFSVVVSTDGRHRALPHAQLAEAVAAQLADELGLPPPQAARVIDEQRATIVPRPGLRRPPAALAAAGLFLAGDSADSEYPSTIEGSVRSGRAAARALIAAATGAAAAVSR